MSPALSYIQAPTLNGRVLASTETLAAARKIDAAQRRAAKRASRRLFPLTPKEEMA